VNVRFSPRARRRVKVVAKWWRENRPAVPTLFEDELIAAVERLRSLPTRGPVYATVDGVIIRRLLLPRTEQHVFYGMDEEGLVIVIHTVWGARRGRGPRLP
jgi:plasmid stabilization system protein ParE